MSDISEMTFEAAYDELRQITQALENGEVSLEESVTLYERGRELGLHCEQLLERAQLRISKLNEDGSTEAL